MVRILNFFCVALMGLSILALYHVSEKTRVAHMQLNQVNRQIAREHGAIGVLETEWEHVAGRRSASRNWRSRGWAWPTTLGAAILLRSAAAPRRGGACASQQYARA